MPSSTGKNFVRKDENVMNITKINSDIFLEIVSTSIIEKRWLDNSTFFCEILMPYKLKVLLADLIENDTVALVVEHWTDENTFHYGLMFEDETVYISEKMSSKYLDDLILKEEEKFGGA